MPSISHSSRCRITSACSGQVKASRALHAQGARHFALPLMRAVESVEKPLESRVVVRCDRIGRS
jgi:hypothetical protein